MFTGFFECWWNYVTQRIKYDSSLLSGCRGVQIPSGCQKKESILLMLSFFVFILNYPAVSVPMTVSTASRVAPSFCFIHVEIE